MNIRTIILILAALLILGICSAAFGSVNRQPSDFGNPVMQDNAPDDDSGEGGTEDGSISTVSPETEMPASGADVYNQQPASTDQKELNLQNALAGIADFDVSLEYDTSISHAENTPQVLRDLGVTYVNADDPTSPVAKRTMALQGFDLIRILANKYDKVEEDFAADPEKDFSPDDPETTLNYFQPREDPFVIPELIPDELRPELEGTGLDGAVDPELLDQIFWAQYAANLRLIPIIVIGTIQAGSSRGVIYTIAGAGFTRWLGEGESDCLWWGAPFRLTCSQVGEDFVVITLVGTYDGRCSYAATSPVLRTFHINR